MNSLIPYLRKDNLALLLFALLAFSCKRQGAVAELPDSFKPKLAQGIIGKVLIKEGTFTSAGEIVKNGRIYGVERQVLFYERTSIKDVEISEGDFIKYISTELLDSATSDKYGNFNKYLPEGNYSIFIKESNRLYSKLEEQDCYLPFTVAKDSSVKIIIEVDYKAVYSSGQ